MVEVSVAVKELLVGVGVVVPPTVSDTQSIDPPPWIIAEVFVVAAFCSVIAPETERAAPEFTVRVVVLGAPLLKVIDLQEAFAVTVIEAPAMRVMSSAAAGTLPPAHVVPAFQLPPDAVLVFGAPK